jgi:hypothetical protein
LAILSGNRQPIDEIGAEHDRSTAMQRLGRSGARNHSPGTISAADVGSSLAAQPKNGPRLAELNLTIGVQMMKRFALLAAVAAVMMSGSIAASASDLPSPVNYLSPSLTKQNITTDLEALGYTNVFDVKGAGSYYTAQAYYHDLWYPLDINIDTGAVTSRVEYNGM